MKVAISTDRGVVSAHFGRCPSFTVLDIDEGKVTGQEEIENPGHEPGFLPAYFNQLGVHVIIAGGMGARATLLFEQSGIKTILGVGGQVQSVVARLLKGELKGGESLCKPGQGKGYGVEKTECDHGE